MLPMLTTEEIYSLSTKFTFCSHLFNLSAGLISNVFIILVLSNLRIFRGNQCAFYLLVEAISNIGLILIISPSNIYAYITGTEPMFISLPWCKIKSTFGQVFGLCSVYTICCTTFDQYLSTNHRYSLRRISTLKLAHRLIIFNVCFVILHSILFLIYTDISFISGCSVWNPVVKKYFSFFYYPILNSGLPLIITIVFSLLAYRNVRHIVRRQISVIRRRLDRQLTAIVLARVICLIVLGLPYIIYSLYQVNLVLTENDYMEIAIANLIGSITYSLLYANFSINFYVFLCASSRFRRQVKSFLVKHYWRLSNWLFHARTTNSNRNQVAPEIDQRVVSSVKSTQND